MELTWLRDDAFTLKDQKNAIILNPYKSIKAKGPYSAAVLTESDHALYANDILSNAGTFVCDWPGEYEIGGALIEGTEIPGTEDGAIHTVFTITSPENITFCHIGALQANLPRETIEEIGTVDVLMINVDQHAERKMSDVHALIDDLGPSFVIPYATDPAAMEKFAKEVGITLPESRKTLKFTHSMVGGDIIQYVTLQGAE